MEHKEHSPDTDRARVFAKFFQQKNLLRDDATDQEIDDVIDQFFQGLEDTKDQAPPDGEARVHTHIHPRGANGLN